MTAGARRVLAVLGGLVFGFALGAASTAYVPAVDGNSAGLGGIGIGLGVGMLVAALVRE
jgi:hypothetical protein